MNAVAFVAGVTTYPDTIRRQLLCFAWIRCPFCGRLHRHKWPPGGVQYERQPICGSPRGYIVTTTPRTARQYAALTRPTTQRHSTNERKSA